MIKWDKPCYKCRSHFCDLSCKEPKHLQALQRTWVGLTDEEKSDLWCKSTGRNCVNEDTHVFADAIEAKLKDKNI